MKQIPMLYTKSMILALLAGNKVQTRRLKFNGEPGDLIWVRETWLVSGNHDAKSPSELPVKGCTVFYSAGGSAANESCGWRVVEWPSENDRPDWTGKTRVSIHMPKWASRITLKVKAIRKEPLQSISDEDVLKEGLQVWGGGDEGSDGKWHRLVQSALEENTGMAAPDAYRELWDSLHYKDAAWSDNPEVYVIDFELALGNVLEIAEAS